MPKKGEKQLEKAREGKDTTKPISEEQTQERTADSRPSGGDVEPSIPFDIGKIDPEKLKMAEELGIPLNGILQWVVQTDAKVNFILENLPTEEGIEKGLERTLEKLRQKAIQQQKEAFARGGGGGGGGQGGGGLGQIAQLAQLFGGGGGGMDEEMMNLNKTFIRVSIANMQKRADASDRIVDAVVTKIAGKAIGKVIE